MKFSKIITNVDIDKEKVELCEKKLTKVFLDLSSGSSLNGTNVSQAGASGLQADPFIFSLVYPVQHILSHFVIGETEDGKPIYSMPTACTTGKRITWGMDFLLSLNLIGARFIIAHEAYHAHYMHARRFVGKNHKLMNICVDYAVDYLIMDDARKKGFDPGEMFRTNLGQFATLDDLVKMITTKKIHLDKTKGWFYSDPDLPEEYRLPERLYKYLYDLMQKNGYSLDEDPGDLLDHTLDQHEFTEESEKETIKRMLYAANVARQMGKGPPGQIAEEIGELIEPKIRWQDSIRMKKSSIVKDRNDWTKFRARPMFAGLMVPKKIGYDCKFGCMLDSSGSMQHDDFIYGISQLQSLLGKAHGHIVSCDTACHWDHMKEIKSCTREDLKSIKICGRSGTVLHSFFNEYEEKMGECDFLIVITDGGLFDNDLEEMENPGKPVYWLITSVGSNFKPPFGKAFQLR